MVELAATRVGAWEGIAGLQHGFLGRHGGVSAGAFASLNLSTRVEDDPEAVAENHRRVLALLGPGRSLAQMRQVHGDRVVVVRSANDQAGEADALVCAAPGIVLGVLTADCVPILLLAPHRRVVAAVHAGWRGTVAGVVVRAIETLRVAFGVEPSDLAAALGPAIGACCYEVDQHIGEEFARRWGRLPPDAWRESGAKGFLDLRVANAQQLRGVGVASERIHLAGPCTRCAATDYFSHRGSGGTTGRQLSYIGWA